MLNKSRLKKLVIIKNIYSVYLLYLIIGKVGGHTDENNRNKYLVFDFTDENKEALKKHTGDQK